MNRLANQEYSGERPLFGIKNTRLQNVLVRAGESALKHVENLEFRDCRFEGKYPLWHAVNVDVENTVFDVGARAAIWYSRNVTMRNTRIDAPKMFRDMSDIRLTNVRITDAKEAFWHCKNIVLRNVQVDTGDYAFMHSENILLENCDITANYIFQYARNITVRNCRIKTRDAFWNTEDVHVENTEIESEFLAWHSHRVEFVNCDVSGLQPLCYAHDLILKDCRMGENSEFCFEYSEVQASISNRIVSIRNPHKGRIVAKEIGQIVWDEWKLPDSDCEVKEV